MKVGLISRELCTGCSACYAVCPANAIIMDGDNEGFLRPVLNDALCIGCGSCENVCPTLRCLQPDEQPECYAARTKDHELLALSSSGGIFTELASDIFREGGCVFGCVLEGVPLKAVHIKAENAGELIAMRGSKYVQSDLQNAFRDVRTEVLRGRKVLFSGTPCQVAGLVSFLGQKYGNLLTVDFICHGVPSPAVWSQYQVEMAHVYGYEIVGMNFRDKTNGWNDYSCRLFFADGSTKREPNIDNLYIRAFMKNFDLRPCCYNCQFNYGRSMSDVTVGDFWGIGGVCREFDDGLGCSAVILHSGKAKDVFCAIKPRVDCKKVRESDIVQRNSGYHKSKRKKFGRLYFMRKFRSQGIGAAYKIPWRCKLILGRIHRILQVIVGR